MDAVSTFVSTGVLGRVNSTLAFEVGRQNWSADRVGERSCPPSQERRSPAFLPGFAAFGLLRFFGFAEGRTFRVLPKRE